MGEDNGIFSQKYRLPFYECDYKKRMKLSAILKYTAEIAGLDYTLKGYGHEILWEKQMVFLLSRISFKIFRYPTQQDILDVSTYECGKAGALFKRGVDIKDEKGNILISYLSGWILANPTTRKIYRPDHFPFNMPQLMDRPCYALPLRKIPHNNLLKCGSKTITVSDLDCNGHVYNANYADMCSDVLPTDVYEKSIDNFRINYINEAMLGETIEFYTEQTKLRIVIVGRVGEKQCFEAEYILK